MIQEGRNFVAIFFKSKCIFVSQHFHVFSIEMTFGVGYDGSIGLIKNILYIEVVVIMYLRFNYHYHASLECCLFVVVRTIMVMLV